MGGGKGGSPSNFGQIIMQQQQMQQQSALNQQQIEQMEKIRKDNNIQKSKNITETASAARQAQRDKAAKSSGISGSILTDPLGINDKVMEKKNMLGK